MDRPLTSTARGDRTRERASHARSFALALALADDLSQAWRADVAHLLLSDWTADAYSAAREILRGVTEGHEAPTAEPGQTKIAVARRFSRAVADVGADRGQLAQLDHLIRELRHAWLGRDLDAAEMQLLRMAARTVIERRAALGAAGGAGPAADSEAQS